MSKEVKLTIQQDPVKIELWLEEINSLVMLKGKDPNGITKNLICFFPNGEVLLEACADMKGLLFDNDGCLVLGRRSY